MKTLELKDLKGYLGTGLKCNVNSCAFPDPVLIGLKGIFAYFNYHGTQLSFEISKVKPLLLHLSALTEPLEDGSVPIVIVGNMLGFYNLTAADVDGVTEYGWSEHICDDYQGYSFGWSEKLKTFGVWHDCIDGNPIDTMCSLDAIEYLYSKHFDIHGLISEGLAIDKRTVKS